MNEGRAVCCSTAAGSEVEGCDGRCKDDDEDE